MTDEYSRLEEDKNYRKSFYKMVEKVDKLFKEYEKMTKPEKKEGPDDHVSVNHERGGKEPPEPPSPSSSESYFSSSSHHSRGRKAYRNPFLKLDVKFDMVVFSGESSAKKLDN